MRRAIFGGLDCKVTAVVSVTGGFQQGAAVVEARARDGGGEKEYQNGGEVVPLPKGLLGVSLPSSQKRLSGTARSRQGRAVVGRGEADP
jgi:hypothetical protein